MSKALLQDDKQRAYRCNATKCGYDGDKYCQNCGFTKGEAAQEKTAMSKGLRTIEQRQDDEGDAFSTRAQHLGAVLVQGGDKPRYAWKDYLHDSWVTATPKDIASGVIVGAATGKPWLEWPYRKSLAVAMPDWWTPEDQFAWLKDGFYYFHRERAEAYGAARITADLTTGAEVPADIAISTVNDALARAIKELEAVEVTPGRYARVCNDCSEHHGRWIVLSKGSVELYADDLAKGKTSSAWGSFKGEPVIMPDWWTPEHRFVWRVNEFGGTTHIVPMGEEPLAWGGFPIKITADLTTGAEVTV